MNQSIKIPADEFNLGTICVFPNGMQVAIVAPDMTSLGYAWNRLTNGAKKLYPDMIETVQISPQTK